MEITGKQNDLYKMSSVLHYIKEHHDTSYMDEKDLNRRLIKVLNELHLETTGSGNRVLDPLS